MSHRLAIAIAATLLAAAFYAPSASAVTYNVGSELDGSDINPGDGSCNAAIEGPPLCTLRAAVEDANALAGPDRITVPAGDYHLTRSTVLSISSELEIIGASPRTVTVRQLGDIDTGEGTDRVFNVTANGRATLRRLTITNGRGDSRNNQIGGNIRNNQGELTLDEVNVVGGEANFGGGVANVAGTLTIIRSTITDNHAPAEAGVEGDAGGILNLGNDKVAASLQIETSTISGNTARLIGGIVSRGNVGNKVAIANSTIAFNIAGDLGGGGGVGIKDGTATFENTIVANNESRGDPTLPNCTVGSIAMIGSLGHNLESATDCGFKATGDIQSKDPLLLKLGDNGGRTDTHALNAGSPAIDTANDAACIDPDQRLMSRPQGPHCDIGAFERDQPPETTLNGPSGRINDPTPTFTFSSNEPGSTKTPFECLLDAATDWIACNSPLTLGPFADGSNHTLRVRAIDLTNNVDPTPATRSFTIDTTAPGAPSITSSVPASPANDNAPELKGTAEASSTVRIYTTADCSGAEVASGTAAAFANPGLTVNVANNTTTNFRATATDVAGNVSACSAPAFTYVEDSAAPAAPSITSSVPASPADENAPELRGTAAAGSTVRIYTTADCTGAVAATGTAAAFANPGLTVNVANNSTTNFRATATDGAGNVSACSAQAFTYVEDSTDPLAPSITSSTPASPANDNAPELKGTAEAGSTVRLYTTADCTGTVAATGPAATFANAGLTVNVADNTTTDFRATATDAAGNPSPCSAALRYVEDSLPPARPSITSSVPASPASDNAPELKGIAQGGSTVRIYTTGTCTGTVAATGPAATFANPGLTVNVASNSTTNFRATATDVAGNTSLCSAIDFEYVEDSTGPGAPTIDSGPDGPTNDSTPTFGFTGSTDTVTFQCRVPPELFAPCTSPHTTDALADGPHTFVVRGVDLAGNTGNATIRDFNIETGPPETTIADGPSGAINDSTPTFNFGSDDPAATFQCRFDGDDFAACTSPHTPAVPLGDGPHTFDVRAMDAAANTDASPATRAFTIDTRPPETSIVSGPAALTTDSTPVFEFSSDEPGSTFECSLDQGEFTACSSPFATPALSPGAHTFVVRAIDPSGNVDPSPALGIDAAAAQSDFTLLGQAPGAPVLGGSFNLEEVSGDIFVSVPAGAAVARARAAQVPPGYQSPVKGRVFVPLEEVRQLPMGSFVDARFGTSRMLTARNRRGRTQSGNFSAGVFQVLQSRARKAGGLTELRLKGGSFNRCRAGASDSSGSATAAGLSRRAIRRLRSSATGRFRTRGRNSSATVRGTIWITTDRCDGTLTTVKRGRVAVRDFRRRKTVLVRTGKSYLARAQR